MNRAEVLEKLEPMIGVRVREIEHSAQSKVVVRPDAVIIQPGNRQHALTMALDQIGGLYKFAGVAPDMGGKLTPDTSGRVLNEILRRKEKYTVVTKDNQITGFAKAGSYHNTPPERVMEAISKGIPGDLDFNRVLLHDHSATLEVVGINEQAVDKGDLVRAGTLVQFSPIGVIQPQVRAFVMRLVCTNGATSNDGFSQFTYGGEGGDIWSWLRSSTRDAYKAVGSIVDRWKRMKEERVAPADRALMLQGLIKDARMSKEVADAVHARSLEVPPENSYDMLNLITWASSHAMDEPLEILRAHNTVAKFTHETQHARLCPTCRKNR